MQLSDFMPLGNLGPLCSRLSLFWKLQPGWPHFYTEEQVDLRQKVGSLLSSSISHQGKVHSMIYFPVYKYREPRVGDPRLS
jgi:hypothetical protein